VACCPFASPSSLEEAERVGEREIGSLTPAFFGAFTLGGPIFFMVSPDTLNPKNSRALLQSGLEDSPVSQIPDRALADRAGRVRAGGMR